MRFHSTALLLPLSAAVTFAVAADNKRSGGLRAANNNLRQDLHFKEDDAFWSRILQTGSLNPDETPEPTLSPTAAVPDDAPTASPSASPTFEPTASSDETPSPVVGITPAPTTDGTAVTGNIVEVLSADDDFDTLVSLVVEAELDGLLASDGPFTVFGPTDEAFENDISNTTLERLAEDEWSAHLQDLLAYHVLDSLVEAQDLTDGANAVTLNDESVLISLNPTQINDANVIEADIEAFNGVIHKLDGVLLPTSATENIVDLVRADPDFSTLVSLVDAANLTTLLEEGIPLTLFAPTNDAFDDVDEELLEALGNDTLALQSVLTYHVVEGVALSSKLETGSVETIQGGDVEIVVDGSSVTVNNANVIEADVLANNGLVHVIDAVLIPTNGSTAFPTPDDLDIVQVLSAADDFETLVDLVVEADLANALANGDNLTVFAPTDDAFDVLDAASPDFLPTLREPGWNGHLVDLLLYHVLGSIVEEQDLTDGDNAETLNGESVLISLSPTQVNDANVIVADIEASNGVIHAVDAPLASKWVTNSLEDVARADDDLAALMSLIDAANLTSLLQEGVVGPFTVFAPTFESIPEAALDFLKDPANSETLIGLLSYHVVPGNAYSNDLTDGQSVMTVQGTAITIGVDGISGAVSVTDAVGRTSNVVEADMLANNGLIHKIDGVLFSSSDLGSIPGLPGLGELELVPVIPEPTSAPETDATPDEGEASEAPSMVPSQIPSQVPSVVLAAAACTINAEITCSANDGASCKELSPSPQCDCADATDACLVNITTIFLVENMGDSSLNVTDVEIIRDGASQSLMGSITDTVLPSETAIVVSETEQLDYCVETSVTVDLVTAGDAANGGSCVSAAAYRFGFTPTQ